MGGGSTVWKWSTFWTFCGKKTKGMMFRFSLSEKILHCFSMYCVLKMTVTFGSLEVPSQAHPAPLWIMTRTAPLLHCGSWHEPHHPVTSVNHRTISSCSPSRPSTTSPYHICPTSSRWPLPQILLLLLHPPHCALCLPQCWGAELSAPNLAPAALNLHFQNQTRLACLGSSLL